MLERSAMLFYVFFWEVEQVPGAFFFLEVAPPDPFGLPSVVVKQNCLSPLTALVA